MSDEDADVADDVKEGLALLASLSSAVAHSPYKYFTCVKASGTRGACKAKSCHRGRRCTRAVYACDYCGKRFHGHKVNINTHLNEHGKGRLYPCTLCNRTFSCLSNLRSHKKCLAHKTNATRPYKRRTTKKQRKPKTDAASDYEDDLDADHTNPAYIPRRKPSTRRSTLSRTLRAVAEAATSSPESGSESDTKEATADHKPPTGASDESHPSVSSSAPHSASSTSVLAASALSGTAMAVAAKAASGVPVSSSSSSSSSSSAVGSFHAAPARSVPAGATNATNTSRRKRRRKPTAKARASQQMASDKRRKANSKKVVKQEMQSTSTQTPQPTYTSCSTQTSPDLFPFVMVPPDTLVELSDPPLAAHAAQFVVCKPVESQGLRVIAPSASLARLLSAASSAAASLSGSSVALSSMASSQSVPAVSSTPQGAPQSPSRAAAAAGASVGVPPPSTRMDSLSAATTSVSTSSASVVNGSQGRSHPTDSQAVRSVHSVGNTPSSPAPKGPQTGHPRTRAPTLELSALAAMAQQMLAPKPQAVP